MIPIRLDVCGLKRSSVLLWKAVGVHRCVDRLICMMPDIMITSVLPRLLSPVGSRILNMTPRPFRPVHTFVFGSRRIVVTGIKSDDASSDSALHTLPIGHQYVLRAVNSAAPRWGGSFHPLCHI